MVTNKSFTYKIYDLAGTTLLKTYSSAVVKNLPAFSSQINGGFSACSLDLALPFDDYGEGTIVSYGNIVRIYQVDTNNKNGRLIYTGFMSKYSPYFDSAKQGVKVELLGLVSLLIRGYYKDGSSFNKTETSADPSSIIQNIITQANSILPGTPFTYAGTLDNVGVSVTYTYEAKKWVDAIGLTFGLIGGLWYWKIEADGSVHLHEKPSSATHTFTIGKNIESMTVGKSGQTLINSVTVDYDGGTETSDDSGSQTSYGVHSLYANDQQITNSTTAQAKADGAVNNGKDLKISAQLRINTSYDIESIKVGDTCKIRNMSQGNTTFSNNMQIVHISYNPDYVDIQLEEIFTLGTELLQVIS